MNLKEQYARLFKGKLRSNDASLINELVSFVKHRPGRVNPKYTPGVEDVEVHSHEDTKDVSNLKKYKGVIIINGEKRPFITGFGIIPHLPWFMYTDTMKRVTDPYTGKRDEEAKRDGKNLPADDFWIMIYRTLASYALRKNLDDSVTDKWGAGSLFGRHPHIVKGGVGGYEIEIDKAAAKKAAGSAKIQVLDHDDMRETSDNDSGFEGELTFEGTYNGEKWTATKEYLGDGAIFTSVYDADGENMEDDREEVYEEIIDAINEYIGKEGLD
tara:strand:- start:91 stop:900 length:810 start_codon:yes stop_codon:yes gene_type:complete